MKKLRYILIPFSLVYALITEIRNALYDRGWFVSQKFDLPVINVGNLSMGGTGKTPQIEYLIRLLETRYKVAFVSRGYKRKTKGFVVADTQASVARIGDEAFQIHQKFPKVYVAVGEKRLPAIRKVLVNSKTDVILLDDAFQHRAVSAGMNILITAYNKLFVDDFVLPAGDLRECRKHVKRADIVLVSKCPASIDEKEKAIIKQKIGKYFDKDIFFSTIAYDDFIWNKQSQININNLSQFEILLVTGIANPIPLYAFLSEKNCNFESLKFGDHHNFSSADISLITRRFERLEGKKKILLTTEKDYVRLQNLVDLPLYYLSIQTKVLERELFNKKILDYVRKEK